jgi:hypothetical protein
VGKEGEKMKAFELMKLVAENPQKYEGKRYKVVLACVIEPTHNKKLYETSVRNGQLIAGDDDNWAYVNSHTELEEIPQSVPFMEVVKAYSKGKTIKCERNGGYKEYSPCGLKNAKIGLYPDDIFDGEWFIK